MKRIKRILTLLLALATALSLAACGTQKDEPAAGDDGAAAEEKKLVIYSAATDAQVNAVVPLFEERYGIEVEVITGGTGELLARIDAEGDAPYCDVIFGGGESSYSEYKHVFQDYVSPEDANLIESCRNTLGYCTNYNLDSAILMYNTDLIGDIQIKGYKDLLNPELKGKIASADPTASSSAMMHIETILTDFGGLTLENEEGWGFVSDLIKNLDGKLASGTWQQQETGDTDLLSYSAQDLTGPIPEDWTLPSDFKTGDKVRVEVSGDKILYGDIVDGGYLNGFTVAQYADGNLTTVYEFKKGVVRSWQQFFSPDGSKLAVAWAPSTDSTEWSVTLVDLTTSGESTLKLPDMTFTYTQTDEETGESKEVTEAPTFLLLKWQDDKNLVVTASLAEYDSSKQPQTWVYTLP